MLSITLYISVILHIVRKIFYLKVFFDSSISMILLLLDELSICNVHIVSFYKLLNVL